MNRLGLSDKDWLEALAMYVFEQNQLLESLEATLSASDGDSALTGEAIAEIFRVTHTMKGSAAMMKYHELSSMAHLIENMFSVLRDAPNALTEKQKVFALIYEFIDFFRKSIDAIGLDAEVEIQADEQLKSRITAAVEKLKSAAEAADGSKAKEQAPKQEQKRIEQHEDEDVDYDYQVQLSILPCPLVNVRAYVIIRSIMGMCTHIDSLPRDPQRDPATAEQILRDGIMLRFSLNQGESIDAALKKLKKQAYVKECVLLKRTEDESEARAVMDRAVSAASSMASGLRSAQSKLVSVSRESIGYLMDMLGDMVTTDGMIEDYLSKLDLGDETLLHLLEQLRKTAANLQETVISMNLVEIEGVYQRIRRVANEMCGKLNKDVELVYKGGKTQVDRTIFDQLYEPLMHIIRNALDHAVETPAERRQKGKRERARVTVEARNISGEVHISVSDDGRGINRQKVLDKAAAAGWLTKPREKYIDKEIYALILRQGVSTEDEITEYSGRGVGMDVVNRSMQRIGGTISIESTEGYGATFLLRMPASLSVMDAVEVKTGEFTLAIPTSSIGMIVVFNRKRSKLAVERLDDGRDALLYEGAAYPITRLDDRLKVRSPRTAYRDGVFLLSKGADNFCVFADAANRVRSIVVKPVNRYLKKLKTLDGSFIGCSILGDGSICMVADFKRLGENED